MGMMDRIKETLRRTVVLVDMDIISEPATKEKENGGIILKIKIKGG